MNDAFVLILRYHAFLDFSRSVIIFTDRILYTEYFFPVLPFKICFLFHHPISFVYCLSGPGRESKCTAFSVLLLFLLMLM